MVIGGWWLVSQRGLPPEAVGRITPLPITSPLTTGTIRQPESPLTGVQRNLRIDAVDPVSRSVNVPVDVGITIGFNRISVIVERTTDQRYLPQPVRIEPAVSGRGEWIMPNNFRFQPTTPLAGGATYRVWVVPFVGIEGRELKESHSFTFTTVLPVVTYSEPAGTFVPPDAVVKVGFDHAMTVDSTNAAFSLQELSTKRLIQGHFVWSDSFKTLKFYPQEVLKLDEVYLIGVARSAQPASRLGTLQQVYSSQFATLPLPYIESISPVPGQQDVGINEQVTIRFSTFMSATCVLEQIRIEPPITPTLVYRILPAPTHQGAFIIPPN